jgi:hypothetical protein
VPVRGKPTTPTSEPIDDPINSVVKTQNEAAQRGALTLWVIYDHPTDHPDDIVARRHEVRDGKSTPMEHRIGGDLVILREIFRRAGLTCIPRQEDDDVKILETWI